MFMHGILMVRIGDQQWKPRPNLSSLFPVLIDLYEDGSIRDLEVLVRHVKHYVDSGLEAPKQCKVGRVVVLEENAVAQLPDVWFSSDHSLFYVQAIRTPTTPVRHIQVADHVIVDITTDNMVAGLWLLDLPPEVRMSCNQPRYIHNASAPNTQK
jgi:hypothetical protein